jgi:hypothetical protein
MKCYRWRLAVFAWLLTVLFLSVRSVLLNVPRPPQSSRLDHRARG